QDAACPTVEVPITGAGVTPGVQVSRSGADFGAVRVGTISAATSFTVTNVGDATFTVSSVALSNPGDFALELTSPGPASYPVTLPPGASVTFTVSATPSTVGLRTGTVIVTTDLNGPPVQLALVVVGVAPGLTVSDTRIDFGAVDVQGPGATHRVT